MAAANVVTSPTNAALDATDRFILRSTDKTLWFDADGIGAAKSVMVCDLQANAPLTADQLLLI